MEKTKGFLGYVVTMFVFISVIFVFVFTPAWHGRVIAPSEAEGETHVSQQQQAEKATEAYFKRMPDGRSYRAVAWGYVQKDAYNAGTGTRNPIYGVTGEPPSPYSLVHRLKMRNGFGEKMIFDVRVFFSAADCTEIVGMEYMADDDTDRVFLQ